MRNFKTAFPPEFLPAFQTGTLAYTYKGIACRKNPIDLAIYTKLIWDLRPGSLIEIGSKRGGSAVWFADQLTAVGLDCPVLSIDLQPPGDIVDPRIEFLAGDAARLGECLSRDRLTRLAHPWLIVEDSAHLYPVTIAVIRFFADATQTDDVLVVEDGVIDDLGLIDRYHGGPNRAVAEFMAASPKTFRVMEEYCDMFGTNVTYNPNGYLARL
jgi:cephalosporin hydroxylase